jgi:putative membrane protein
MMIRSFAVAALLVVPLAARAEAPTPAEVLSKLHESNQKEIEMGKQAEKNGQSKEVKSFGRTLVTDHTAADKQVKALAKQENVDLEAAKPAAATHDHQEIAAGPDFDTKFAQAMLDDHNKDVTEAKSARDQTQDPKLKGLLTKIVPTLEKHQQMAQKIVDGQKGQNGQNGEKK